MSEDRERFFEVAGQGFSQLFDQRVHLVQRRLAQSVLAPR
jgi:hypothetical protein